MSYSVEHIRFTLECDVCGRVEKRDLDGTDLAPGTAGWGSIMTSRSFFCCPGCTEDVNAILERRERAQKKAQEELEANCVHDYQPLGFLAQCTKCRRFR